jgi:hypothetical protein
MTFIIVIIGCGSLIAFAYGATMLWMETRTDPDTGSYRDGETD